MLVPLVSPRRVESEPQGRTPEYGCSEAKTKVTTLRVKGLLCPGTAGLGSVLMKSSWSQ